MTIAETVGSQSVIPQGVGAATQGITKGLDAGLAYAAAKQKSDQMDQQLQMMKDQHEQQKTAYVIDQLNKASQTDAKPLRKLYLDAADQSFQKFYGKPMSDDIKSFITNIPEASAGIRKLVEMYPNFASDPQAHAKFVGDFVTMFNCNISDAEKVASSIAQAHAKLIAAKTKGDIAERRADQSDRRLDQGDKRLEFNAVKNAQNATPVQDSATQLLGAKKGLSIIDQGLANNKKTPGKTITWSQLHEVTGDLAGLTSAKISAVVPVAKQAGIEADIPKVSEALGSIEREFNQAPSDNVPVGVLTRLKSQFQGIQKVVQVYHDEQLNQRLKAGTATGVLKESTAQQFAPQSQPQQQQPSGTVTQGNDMQSRAKSLKDSTGKAFKDLSPQVQKKLNDSGITQQAYDSM